jgi:hypothetical protein
MVVVELEVVLVLLVTVDVVLVSLLSFQGSAMKGDGPHTQRHSAWKGAYTYVCGYIDI